jgi:hypothetical protein
MDFVNDSYRLYRFITAPISAASEETPNITLGILICALYTLGIYSNSGWAFGLFGYISLTLTLLVFGLISGIFIDTLAQLLFKSPPQGLRTGYWMIISQLPALLGFPLSQIATTLQLPALIWISNIGTTATIIYLQFQFLKVIYGISNRQSLLLMIALPATLILIALLVIFSGATYLLNLG